MNFLEQQRVNHLNLIFPPEITGIIIEYADGEVFFRIMLPRIHNWFAGRNMLIIYNLDVRRTFQRVSFSTRVAVIDHLDEVIRKFTTQPGVQNQLVEVRRAVLNDASVRILVRFIMRCSPWEHVSVYFHGPFLN